MHVWRISRWTLLLLLVAAIALLGVGLRDVAWWRDIAYGRPLEFTPMGVAELPLSLIDAYAAGRWHEGLDACHSPAGELLYVLIRWGQQPTGGHRIEPVAVSLAKRPRGWQVRITAEYRSPAPGQPVIEVLTFPAVGLEVELPPDMPASYTVVVVDQAGRIRASTGPLRGAAMR